MKVEEAAEEQIVCNLGMYSNMPTPISRQLDQYLDYTWCVCDIEAVSCHGNC